MADIRVTASGGDSYQVTVTDATSTTSHRVSADSSTLERLAPSRSDVDIIEASFRFLLDREPKESILSSFDLSIIGRYFSEYEAVLGSYLGGD